MKPILVPLARSDSTRSVGSSVVAPAFYRLRCDRCKNAFSEMVAEVMQLICSFKPSLFTVVVPKTHVREVRHRCRGCGWVNIFHPAD